MPSMHDDRDQPLPIRILLVEDDKVDQQAFRRFVIEQQLPYDLSVTGSVAEAAAQLDTAKFDILVADYMLGDGTALDILAQTKNDIPVVVVTGSGSEAIAVDALKAGAYDYLIKDIDRNYLMMMPITIKNTIRRYHAEETIKNFYAELETKVRERTQELAETNTNLQEALVMAEAGTKARNEFLANTTHELVTPLNAIIGFSQVMLDGIGGTLNTKQQEYMQAILQSGERLNEAYNTILQVAGLESGQMQLLVDRFSLKDFLQSFLLSLKEKAIMQGVTLSMEFEPPSEIEIEADCGKLRQVMFSLLDNAIKFTPRGGVVSISVGLLKDERGDASIGISITDTGIGIKTEDMKRLFKPFQQLESVYTKKYKGTGLGLVLAQKLIELHNGRIWVESEFGTGTTVTFVMPVRQAGNNKPETEN